MIVPNPFPYQGSKRIIANQILRYFPSKQKRLIEPFAGSAAISLASSYFYKADSFLINDLNEPLITLWDKIINYPQEIISAYYDIWYNQIGREEDYYYEIREKFNSTHQPEYLLFLFAKCVKAAVRYNDKGEFNQSPDNRRLGRNPESMRDDILKTSTLLKGKTELLSTDYENVLQRSTPEDLIYMDPPYQGTGLNGGFRYHSSLEFSDFVIELHKLNKRNIPYILSFDGRTGDKEHGVPLPEKLELHKIEINAGRSSQATLLNRNHVTIESLYLSPALFQRIKYYDVFNSIEEQQLILFD